MPDPDQASNGACRFQSTCWTTVLATRDSGSPEAQAALETLCRTYWYPIYAFIRRWGHPTSDAEDLTQDFFTRLLARNDLASVDPARGKFRTFLLTACRNFLLNRRKHDVVHPPPFTFDFGDAENRYTRELADDWTPERIFDRRWALTLLGSVLDQLEEEMVRRGKGPLFERLRPLLLGGPDAGTHAMIGADLGMTGNALRVAVHRLRNRFRALLRAEIGWTVADPDQVDEEIKDLFAALGASGR
jgi:RNA polymerase sigma factor (sigma-70 family)